MRNLEIKLRESKRPAGLSPSEVVCLRPILEVLVIGDHHEFRKSLEVMTPIFEGSNNRYEFLVVDFIVVLRSIHCLGSVRDWMPQTIVTFLREYIASDKVGCIYLYFSQAVWIVKRQNGCFCECLLERSECCFLIFFPALRRVLLCEVVERTRFG